MMTYKALDDHLRNLTQKEQEFRDLKRNNNDWHELKTTSHDGIEAAVLNIEHSPFVQEYNSNPNFLIAPHTRFSVVPEHFHSYVEMSYIYSGSVQQTIHRTPCVLKKGQVCLIDTGTPHAIGLTSENDIMINIMLSKDYLSIPFLSRISSDSIIANFFANAISNVASHNNYIIFHSEGSRRIHLYFKELLCEYFSPSANTRQVFEILMTLIFSELITVYEHDEFVNRGHTSNALIFPILRYIESNYMTCSLKSTASFFNLNPNYLSSLLKKNVGKTYIQLVTSEKLAHAAYLLKNTQLPIYEIANSVGYENLSFFFEKFQQQYHKTPKEFRNHQIFPVK